MTQTQPWYTNAIIYALDVETFKDSDGDGVGDFIGATSQLGYLQDLGVTCIWLLPFYSTTNLDNGYDVVNHLDIDHRSGKLEDVHEFIQEVHQRGMRVIADLVYHHTSTEHPWFQAGRIDPTSPFRDYYIWSDTLPDIEKNNPTNKPAMLGEQTTVWTYDHVAKAYYYHRFYDYEPDLNLRNPQVQAEIYKIMDYWLSFGFDGFRVDAATMAFEKKGIDNTEMTNPISFIEKMRRIVKAKNPDGLLLGEADVVAEDFNQFVKNGTRFQLLYNFYLNAHLFLSLAEQTNRGLHHQLRDQIKLPTTCEWLNFTRNLDELNLEKLSSNERQKVYQAFAPSRDMRAYHRGIRRRLAPMLDGNQAWLKMTYSLLFSLPGAVLISYGDEIGMGDNLTLPYRMAVRTPMQWTSGENGGFSRANVHKLVRGVIETGTFSKDRLNVEQQQADEHSLLNVIKSLISLRKEFSLASSAFSILPTPKQIFGLVYAQQPHDVFMLANLSEEEVEMDVRQLPSNRLILLESSPAPTWAAERLKLPPFGYIWLTQSS